MTSLATPFRLARRRAGVYLAFAGMAPKVMLTYNVWFWMQLFVQALAMTISVFFWKAVYVNSSSVGGMQYGQTINYILLAQILAGLAQNDMIFRFGRLVADGSISLELLRPVDFQAANYATVLAEITLDTLTRLPLLLLGLLVFGLRLPGDPLAWGAFLVSVLLGTTLLFFFDWMLGCLAFYTTEVWGLAMLRFGIATFLSGSLVPLTMMPGLLRTVAEILPFSQALFVPVSFLAGITPVADAPRIWLNQLLGVLVLATLSRFVFARAVKRVTVQGG